MSLRMETMVVMSVLIVCVGALVVSVVVLAHVRKEAETPPSRTQRIGLLLARGPVIWTMFWLAIVTVLYLGIRVTIVGANSLYVAHAARHLERCVTILRPRVGDVSALRWEAQIANLKTRSEFVSLTDAFGAAAESSGVTLPSFKIW